MGKTSQGAELNREERQKLSEENLSGVELVPETRRLGLMNMVLHDLYGDIRRDNSLQNPPSERFDVILANPPYGGQNQEEPLRDDFFVESKKPELNFLQHSFSMLNDGGRCGIVVPDGVLFQTGQAKRVREHLMKNADLHTVLILPIGAFHPYTNVTTNILFFEKGVETEEVDFYDLRTDTEKIKKSNPLTNDHFEDFLNNWDSREDANEYLSVSIDEIKENDWSLNYKKYKQFDNADEQLPAPEELLTELLSLQETISQNTQQILKEIEAKKKLMSQDYEMPERWELKTLGDVAKFQNGNGFSKSDWEKDGLRIIRIQNLTGSNDKINYYSGDVDERYHIYDGDILLSWSATLEVFEWQRGHALLNQHIYNVKPYNSEKKFIYYLLKWLLEDIESHTHGSTMKHITKKKLLSIEVPIPPLEEQKAIVEKTR